MSPSDPAPDSESSSDSEFDSNPESDFNPLTNRSFRIADACVDDVQELHAFLRPFVMQRELLARTEAELIDLTHHGFVARDDDNRIVGFSAVEIYSSKLAELQSLAVDPRWRGLGVGKKLVTLCVQRAREVGVMEVLAISASEDFLKSCGFDYSLPDQKKALFCQLRPRPSE